MIILIVKVVCLELHYHSLYVFLGQCKQIHAYQCWDSKIYVYILTGFDVMWSLKDSHLKYREYEYKIWTQ